MKPRSSFQPLRPAPQGTGGGQNTGILLVRHRRTQTLYIEKRIPGALVADGSAEREVRAMQQCRSQAHIVQLLTYDLGMSAATPYGSVYMQYCEVGSLDAVMLRYGARGAYLRDEGFAWHVLVGLSVAVCYLWLGAGCEETLARAVVGKNARTVAGWNSIMHRDIKASNVFLTWGPGGGVDEVYPRVVLADFGCAVSTRDVERGTPIAMGGDEAFAPPETRQRWFSEKSDVWGVGLVVHCLVLMSQVPVGSAREREGSPFGECRVGRALTKVVAGCLRREARNRWGPGELPRVVWSGYTEWQRGGGRGRALPAWAFG